LVPMPILTMLQMRISEGVSANIEWVDRQGRYGLTPVEGPGAGGTAPRTATTPI
jgi:hypothetical protein